jgi:hypothetical protein
MTYGSGHGVANVSYPSKEECLAVLQERLKEESLAVQIGIFISLRLIRSPAR